jgi:hypothetical protein
MYLGTIRDDDQFIRVLDIRFRLPEAGYQLFSFGGGVLVVVGLCSADDRLNIHVMAPVCQHSVDNCPE